MPEPLWIYLMAFLYFTNVTTCSAIADAFDSVSHAIGPRSRRRPLLATQHHPTASLVGISWIAMSHAGLCQVF